MGVWACVKAVFDIASLSDVRAMTKELQRLEIIMGVREDAADARQAELIGLIRDRLSAQDDKIDTLTSDLTAMTGERDALRTALEAANADVAGQIDAAVTSAMDADSDADAAKKEETNAALDALAEPPAAPSDGGDTPGDGSADDGPSPSPSE